MRTPSHLFWKLHFSQSYEESVHPRIGAAPFYGNLHGDSCMIQHARVIEVELPDLPGHVYRCTHNCTNIRPTRKPCGLAMNS